MTYFSVAQLPKSIVLQRSLQKGMKGSFKSTVFLQMGQGIVIVQRIFYRLSGAVCWRFIGTIWISDPEDFGVRNPDSLASISSPTKS